MLLLRDLVIGRYFANINDPRIERTKDHTLLDIISIAIAAVICGTDGWVDVEQFGTTRRLLDFYTISDLRLRPHSTSDCATTQTITAAAKIQARSPE